MIFRSNDKYARYATFSTGERMGTDIANYHWAFIVARSPRNKLGWKDSRGFNLTHEAAQQRMKAEVAASEARGVEVTLAEIAPVIG